MVTINPQVLTYAAGSPEADFSIPMHERRPEEVEADIDNKFAVLRDQASHRYTENGNEIDYKFPSDEETACQRRRSTIGIIRDLSDQLGRTLNILDVGTGTGHFPSFWQDKGHLVHGLTAHDYNDLTPTKEDPWVLPDHMVPDSYIIGDVNRLDEVEGLLPEYDLIVSRYTFMHLVDPLGSFEQVFSRLAPTGVAAINSLSINKQQLPNPSVETVQKLSRGIAGALRSAGFVLQSVYPYLVTDEKSKLSCGVDLIAEKPGESTLPVVLPFDYAIDPNELRNWQYVIDHTRTDAVSEV